MEIKKFKTATILQTASLSDAVDIRSISKISLILPTLDTCNITFKVAEEKTGTYVDLCKIDGTAVTITATTGDKAIRDIEELAGHSWVKIATSAAQATATRLIKVMFKE